MPRMARVVVPHYPHHVTQRGSRRQAVFLQDADWSAYLALIRACCARTDTRVLAYCLMPNHVHFVMVPSHEDGLRAAIAGAHRRHARRVNAREGWRGHLWQERFHSFVMNEPHLHAAIPYVENNPVRAGLCAFPADWSWSSAKEAERPPHAGLVDWSLRERLVGTWSPLDPGASARSEEILRLHTRTGRPLGSDEFVEQIEAATGRVLRPKRRGRKPGPTT
ncbi:MAG: transposase [Halofilum sp. (in: g-proteobacteria)]|nr:transposase [Halofilum sp. (in: g-proteobacteria)]